MERANDRAMHPQDFECSTHIRREGGFNFQPMTGPRVLESQTECMKSLSFKKNFIILDWLLENIRQFERASTAIKLIG